MRSQLSSQTNKKYSIELAFLSLISYKKSKKPLRASLYQVLPSLLALIVIMSSFKRKSLRPKPHFKP